MTVTIYHNPKCGTSRNVLAYLSDNGIDHEVVEYLKKPLTKARLKTLFKKMKAPVREILRKKGTPYAELGLENPKLSDDELIDFIVAHPILMNRPIVETDNEARLCRPSETIRDFIK